MFHWKIFRLEAALALHTGDYDPKRCFWDNLSLMKILKRDELYNLQGELKVFPEWLERCQQGLRCSCPQLCSLVSPVPCSGWWQGTGSSWSHSIIPELPSSPFSSLPPNSHQFWVFWGSILALISIDFGENVSTLCVFNHQPLIPAGLMYKFPLALIKRRASD